MRFYCVFLLLFFGLCREITSHPLNLTVTDIRFENQKMYMKIKLFADDFQASLSMFTKAPVDLVNKPLKQNEDMIKRYISTRFTVRINGIVVKCTLKKTSLVGEVLYAEYEGNWKDPSHIKSMKIKDVLLFDDVPEQKNIVNIQLKEDLKVLTFVNSSNDVEKELNF